jgi:radical SAM protein with 4Fe4S-binding SPASM domain
MLPLRNAKRFAGKALKQPAYAIKVLFARLQAYASYSWARGKSSSPEAVTFFLTHRCNLRCRMCGQWGESGVTKKESAQYLREELSFSLFTSIIDGVAGFKPNITLFGGEPLLYPDCLKLIRYIKEKKLHCLMITNGFLLENSADEIVASGLDELNVSLDGDRELHDEIRGMPGLFDTIMRGLKKIHELKGESGKRTPLLNLQCTITQYNYRDLEQLIGVAEEAHADSLTFHNLIFVSREALERQKEYDTLLGCSSRDWEGFVFDPGIDTQLLSRQIRRILAGKYSFKVDFYPNFSFDELREYYRISGGIFREKGLRCLSPWMAAYIFPDGQVKPCLNSSYSFGNVKENGFLKIWNGKEAVSFRKFLKETKMFPACQRCTELYRY